jgi:hypothetical protein
VESETVNNNFDVKTTEEDWVVETDKTRQNASKLAINTWPSLCKYKSTSKIENGVEEGTDKEVASDNLEKLDIWKQNADDDIPRYLHHFYQTQAEPRQVPEDRRGSVHGE